MTAVFSLFDWQRAVLKQPAADLTSGQKNALIALGLRSDGSTGRNAFHGIEALALACDLTRRHVQTAIDRGQALGLIELTTPADKRCGRAAVYRLTFPDGHRHPVRDARTGKVKASSQQIVSALATGITVPEASRTTVPEAAGGSGSTVPEATGTNTPDLLEPQFHPSTVTGERKGLRKSGTLRGSGRNSLDSSVDVSYIANQPRPPACGPFGPRCLKHRNVRSPGPCPGCGDARTSHAAAMEVYEAELGSWRATIIAAIDNCPDPYCDQYGRLTDQSDCPRHPNLRTHQQGGISA